MIPPTSIDGTDITGATIDGTDVQEITVDGDVVFSAGSPSPSGKYMIVSDRTFGDVFMYEMSTPFDISTAGSPQSQFRPGGDLRGCGVSPDGTKVYVFESNQKLSQYGLTTPFDLSNTNLEDNTLNAASGGDLSFNIDGSILYVGSETQATIDQYNLSTQYDISSRDSGTQGSFSHNIFGISVVDSGQKLYVSNGLNGLFKHDLTTPYDIRTNTNTQQINFIPDDTRGFALREDGTRFFADNRDNDTLEVYDMTTPYDINTITFVDSISAPTSDCIGIGLNGIS